MNSTESTDGMEDIEAGVETEMNEGTDKQTWQDDESGDLEALLESEMDDKETDREDAPDYEFEQDEKTSKDPSYVFCPSHFRKDLLRKLTKHYCQHPLLPEQDGTRTAKEIRDAAVYEMYMFCHQRNLAEVWAYLWTQWYSPKRWHLWARSTTDLISRLRTTMNVENFWRQLKHDFLHHHLRPRLDELTYILVEHVTPAYLERAEILDDDWRYGRAHQLSTWQKYFKRSWLHLAKIECSAREYRTDVSSWTCNCGSQKYNAHLLCKHLVQAVHAPSGRFFTEIRRRRTTPIYRHPELRVHTSTTTPTANSHEATLADMDMGSVTDGDDHGLKGKGLVGGKRREDTGLLTKVRLPSHRFVCCNTHHTVYSLVYNFRNDRYQPSTPPFALETPNKRRLAHLQQHLPFHYIPRLHPPHYALPRTHTRLQRPRLKRHIHRRCQRARLVRILAR